MAGLVFDSLADLPAGVREQAARKLMKENMRATLEPNKQSKYHNIQTEVNGIRFASKKEARRYEILMYQLQMGLIRDLRLQQDFTLQEAYTTPEGLRVRAIRYKADFVYILCATGERVIEDTKGKRTDVYQMKRKMMWQKGYKITEV